MIRRVAIIDLNALCRLFSYIQPKWTDKMIEDAINKSGADFLVYDDGGLLAGFICIEYVLGEGCITAIATDTAYRNKGIARSLISYGETLREKTNIYLEVEENNKPAIGLYSSCGFSAVGKRKNYYGDNAAIIMNKEF